MRTLICLLAALPCAATAMSLDFPALSTPVAEAQSNGDSVFLPLSAYHDGSVQGIHAEGTVRKQSWRVGSGTMTTLQMLVPLRDQLERAGYDVLYECEAAICGGFDFRYELETFPEPEMHVALGDFRYLAAQKVKNGLPEYASLVISRSANTGFVQLIQIGTDAAPVKVTASTKAPPEAVLSTGPLGETLEEAGHATLGDLVFKTGKSELGDARFASLRDLAEYLIARPDREIVLVGHTDSEGSLNGNIALSKRRAAAVMQRLVGSYGVDARQVTADGVGFLSPIASNLTADGRAKNRRVEVILTSTE